MQCRSPLTVLVLLLFIGASGRHPSYAHGGGVNAQGCHTNNKTGSYHCHRKGLGSSGSAAPGSPSPPSSGRLRARVLSVGDGDTIRVNADGQHFTIRLACIDAPEMAQPPFGQRARDQLRSMLPKGSSVLLLVQTKDRYGRSVAEIIKGARNVNQELVASGSAFIYWKYIARCDKAAYVLAENYAQSEKLGVWMNGSKIQKPWEYRRSR